VTKPLRQPSPWTTIATGAAAVGACAVCCAGPILAFFGGLSIVSFAASIWVPAVAIVGLATPAGAVLILRRRHNCNCHASGAERPGPVDLGMPTPTTASLQPTDRTDAGLPQ
jgi:hypothetical protein